MIYVVIEGECSDENILGYFTDRKEADKYCAWFSHRNYYVLPINLLTNTVEIPNVDLKYTHTVIIDNKGRDGWVVRHEPERYDCYMDDYLRSNKVWTDNPSMFIAYDVNIEEDNRETAEKLAIDYHHMLVDMCKDVDLLKGIDIMNLQFSEPERARKELQEIEKLRRAELAELARLKSKYEC